MNSAKKNRTPEIMSTGICTVQSACMALSLCVAASFCINSKENASVKTNGNTYEMTHNKSRENADGHLKTTDSLRHILHHPAFNGFSRLLLPWDDRTYDENMPLTNIGSLLPYHSHVNPGIVVSALNYMIDEAGNGNTIFYDFYTEDQKQENPSKVTTGLFFFRGKPGAPFAVVCPGGGFSYVASVHEGFPFAEEISKKGYNAFVLKYRVGSGGVVATQDLAATISYIFNNAETLGIGTDNYSLWGSSAGARIAASIGTDGVANFGGNDVPKPSAIVMAYTGHADYSSGDPPTFVIVGEHDGIASPSVMERRVAAMRKAGIEVEYHKYKNLGHGFGLGTGTSAEGWMDDAVRFWEKFIPK